MITIDKRGVVYLKDKETKIFIGACKSNEMMWCADISYILDCLYYEYGYRCTTLDEKVLLNYVRYGKTIRTQISLVWRAYHKGILK